VLLIIKLKHTNTRLQLNWNYPQPGFAWALMWIIPEQVYVNPINNKSILMVIIQQK